jgi:hypothetical protein
MAVSSDQRKIAIDSSAQNPTPDLHRSDPIFSSINAITEAVKVATRTAAKDIKLNEEQKERTLVLAEHITACMTVVDIENYSNTFIPPSFRSDVGVYAFALVTESVTGEFIFEVFYFGKAASKQGILACIRRRFRSFADRSDVRFKQVTAIREAVRRGEARMIILGFGLRTAKEEAIKELEKTGKLDTSDFDSILSLSNLKNPDVPERIESALLSAFLFAMNSKKNKGYKSMISLRA